MEFKSFSVFLQTLFLLVFIHMPTRALVSRANKPLFHLRMKTKELLLLMCDGPLIFLFPVMNFYVPSPHNYNPLVLQD